MPLPGDRFDDDIAILNALVRVGLICAVCRVFGAILLCERVALYTAFVAKVLPGLLAEIN